MLGLAADLEHRYRMSYRGVAELIGRNPVRLDRGACVLWMSIRRANAAAASLDQNHHNPGVRFMRQLMLLLITSTIVACVDSPKGTHDPQDSHANGDGKADGDGDGTNDASPFDPSSCAGMTITQEQLQQLTANGTQGIPNGQTWVRSRSCSQALGCGPWSAPAAFGTPADSVCGYRPADSFVILNPRATLVVDSYNWFAQWKAELNVDTGTIYTIEGSQGDQYVNDTYEFDTKAVTFTDHCLRAYGHLTSETGIPSSETEYVWLATF